jgi:hypothetical protein
MMNTIKVNGAAGLGIYCHIPFCLKKCAYCDFSSFSCQSEETIRIYFEALHKEIRNFANENKNSILPMVDTIYFGGGTPSSVDAGQIETTLAILKEVFVIKADAEITIADTGQGQPLSRSGDQPGQCGASSLAGFSAANPRSGSQPGGFYQNDGNFKKHWL